MGKLPNHWTDRDHIWHTYTYSSGNGYRLKKIHRALRVIWRGSGVTNSKIWEICQTAGPIENKFGTRMQIRMHVNGHSWLNKLAPRGPEGQCGGLGGHVLHCGKIATNTCIIILRLSLAKPGNPASNIYVRPADQTSVK